MSDATKKVIFRSLIHALVLMVLYILQTMVFSRLRLMNIAPLLLPLAVVGVGLFEGPTWGGCYGLAAGFLCDAAYVESTVLFTVLLTLLGMGVGLLSSHLLAKGFPSFILCCLGALVVIAFFQLFALLVYVRVEPMALLRVALIQTAYSAVFTLPIYYLSRALGRRIR